YGTLTANLLGCFVIGFLMQLVVAFNWPSPMGRLFLATGFCGGLTTLSSFVYELHAFMQDKEYFYASLYFGGTLLGSVLCFYLGVLLVATTVR
ncbi:MAG: CrcB family protein, partial [Chromatiales bacterium]|nr:CrcB family protein [Chromatiales bacterium]